jgi:hypothetical protein
MMVALLVEKMDETLVLLTVVMLETLTVESMAEQLVELRVE